MDRMTRKEAERQTIQADRLRALGFTREECEQLRRISMTLQRWFERECGDSNQYGDWSITRGYKDTGQDFRHDDDGQAFEERHTYAHDGKGSARTTYTRITDREKGARTRLAAILKSVNVQRAGKVGPLAAYIQTDPRGAALYIIRPGDVPEGKTADAYYTNGLCIY